MRTLNLAVLTLMASTAFTACSAATTSSSDSSSPDSGGVQATTCKELIPQIIDITKDTDTGGKMLAIYKPKLVADHIKAFNNKAFKIPAGKNDVEVLACSGEASFSDGSDAVPITFGMTVDSNDQVFVQFAGA